MKHILRCTACGQYTLLAACPLCGRSAVSPRPAKYSGDDKYADLRRQAKHDGLVEKGLL